MALNTPPGNPPSPLREREVVRLRDIGMALNLSVSTVSRALAGNRLISAETREMVQRVAVSMGYIAPSHGVRKHRVATRTVGILVGSDDLHDRSKTQLLQYIHQDMLEFGYHVVVFLDAMNAATDVAHLATFRPLIDSYLDGMILCSATTDSNILRELRRLGIPTVLAAQSVEGSQVDTVEGDNLRGATEITRHFHELGHRRIGLIMGPQGSSINRDRARGAFDYLNSVGVRKDSIVVAWDAFKFDDGYASALQMLSKADRVTAIVAGSDSVAMGVLEAARTKRISVPDDLLVAAFGDISPSGCAPTGLTTISIPIPEIARMTCRRMVERIRTGGLTAPTHDIVPTRLVLRKTTPVPLRSEQWRVAAYQGNPETCSSLRFQGSE